MSETLLIFTRYPAPGACKTRLIPHLGSGGAAWLSARLTCHTLRWAERLQTRRGVAIRVCGTGAAPEQLRRHWDLPADWRVVAQGPGDLGARLVRAFAEAFADGAQRVVVVGTDTPGLDARRAERAFALLHRQDIVVGPACDGGYYLLGLRSPQPALFQGIAWGTGQVLAQTLTAARRAGLACQTLPPLPDIDRPGDLAHLPAPWQIPRATGDMAAGPLISVIVPTLDEAGGLARVLRRAASDPRAELIVVDGGSRDGTPEIAAACGARVLRTARGRGRQMNAGAEAARGEIVLFLHADTLLPVGYGVDVREALADPGVVAGAFRLGIADRSAACRWVEWGTHVRSVACGLPSGDQALFVRRAVFGNLGGFADWPLLEDLDFVRRVQRRGRLLVLSAFVHTSPRRWQRLGYLRTTWRNQHILAAYAAGVAPATLAEWYRRPPQVRLGSNVADG